MKHDLQQWLLALTVQRAEAQAHCLRCQSLTMSRCCCVSYETLQQETNLMTQADGWVYSIVIQQQ